MPVSKNRRPHDYAVVKWQRRDPATFQDANVAATSCAVEIFDERLARVCGRSSHEAWLYLRRLRDHPKFDEVITRLAARGGTLHPRDVDEALGFVLMQQSQKTEQSSK
jgi:hypothetical protein